MRAGMVWHYIVESLCRCAESLFYVIALLALRLQTGTKPKWQMGRKGRRSCDAWAEIFNRKGRLWARCSASSSAHWLLNISPTRIHPAPCKPEDACHVYYCTMNCRTTRNIWKKAHAILPKNAQSMSDTRVRKQMYKCYDNFKLKPLYRCCMKSNNNSIFVSVSEVVSLCNYTAYTELPPSVAAKEITP